jgi:STE24 endopeptidase
VRGVFKFDMSKRTRAANAALTGIGNTRRIILGDTLIDEFSGDEIETILAHELGHHVHRDIPLLIAFGTPGRPLPVQAWCIGGQLPRSICGRGRGGLLVLMLVLAPMGGYDAAAERFLTLAEALATDTHLRSRGRSMRSPRR